MTTLVLVTGGNGFLGGHLIHQLLTQGYQVRATLRHLDAAETVLDNLQLQQTPHLDQLSFVQADLLTDDGWADAMAGVTHVLSVAAPVFVNGEIATPELIQTATVGTRRILQAAKDAGVQRVVMTANFGAVGFSNHDLTRTTTEDDWTDPNEPGLSPYELSKLLAEKAAWDFAKTSHLTLATVAAGAMLGPAFGNHVSGSFGLVRQLIDGKTRLAPNVRFNISDVRDVVDVHLRALFQPEAAGQRFLAVEDGSRSLPELVTLIRRERPQFAPQLPKHTLPAWLIRAVSPFNKTAKEGALMLSISHQVSNQKARQLGWTPLATIDEAVLATVDSLVKLETQPS
jgi:nucleoside-diphosphate-sugar epimerase